MSKNELREMMKDSASLPTNLPTIKYWNEGDEVYFEFIRLTKATVANINDPKGDNVTVPIAVLKVLESTKAGEMNLQEGEEYALWLNSSQILRERMFSLRPVEGDKGLLRYEGKKGPENRQYHMVNVVIEGREEIQESVSWDSFDM